MVKPRDSKVISLEPNADGKLVVDINSLDMDPNYDYVLQRTITETFTLSKSAKDNDTKAGQSTKAKLNGKDDKTKNRHQVRFSDEPAFAASSTSSYSSRPSSHSHPRTLLLDIHYELTRRSSERSSSREYRDWVRLADDVTTIMQHLDSVGSLGLEPTAILTKDLCAIEKEAEDRLDTGMIRVDLRREDGTPLTQMEWLQEKVGKVIADLDREKQNKEWAKEWAKEKGKGRGYGW